MFLLESHHSFIKSLDANFSPLAECGFGFKVSSFYASASYYYPDIIIFLSPLESILVPSKSANFRRKKSSTWDNA